MDLLKGSVMRKLLGYIGCSMGGGLVGAIVAGVVLIHSMSVGVELQRLRSMSTLQDVVFKVYRAGDYDSTVIALKALVGTLEEYLSVASPKSRDYHVFRSDAGLSYARLFVVYDRKGEEALAGQAYARAKEYLAPGYDVDTTEGLRELIARLDSLHTNDG